MPNKALENSPRTPRTNLWEEENNVDPYFDGLDQNTQRNAEKVADTNR